MGWEKRRFNRVSVELAADLSPVDIDLNILEPIVTYRAKVADISATGMLAFGPRHFKTGMRFRATLRLPDRSVQFFVVVRHSFCKEGEVLTTFGHGMQIVAGTQEGIVALVEYINAIKHNELPHPDADQGASASVHSAA